MNPNSHNMGSDIDSIAVLLYWLCYDQLPEFRIFELTKNIYPNEQTIIISFKEVILLP